MAKVSRAVQKAVTSADGSWLAVLDTWNDVHVYSLESTSYALSLPRHTAQVTAMCFRGSASIIVVDADNLIHEYAVDTGKLSQWCVDNVKNLPTPLLKKANLDPVRLATFNPGTSTLVLGGNAYMLMLDMGQTLPVNVPRAPRGQRKKRSKKEMAAAAIAAAESCPAYRWINRYGPTLFAEFVATNELVVAELPWVRAVQHLPAPLYRKRYGT